jgi:hypothetical protein
MVGAADLRRLNTVRRASSGGGSRDGLTAKFGGNDGTSRSLASEQRVGDIDRSTRGCEFLCKAPRRRQATARLKLALCNCGPKMLVDLTIERDAVVAHQHDATFPGHADHGLVTLPQLGSIY